MNYLVNTINTAAKATTTKEFAAYKSALAYYLEQCEKYNIAENDIDKPLEPNADLSSGGRGYDAIIQLNCIDC